MTARLADEDRTGSEAWSAWHRAADALADAESAADASTVGAALVTALAAAEIPDGPLTPFARGLADYVAWLAAADGASHAECKLAVHAVRQLLETPSRPEVCNSWAAREGAPGPRRGLVPPRRRVDVRLPHLLPEISGRRA